MRLAPPTLAVSPDEGFEHDIFNAKEAGERLANVVSVLEGHSVIVLDGDWGAGKTTFIKQWAGLMRSRSHPVIYFDAFQSDHQSDAFFALLAQVLDHFGHQPNLVGTISDAAKQVVGSIPKVVMEWAIPLLTAGVIPHEALSKVLEVITDPAHDPVDQWFKERVRSAQNEAGSIIEFRQTLSNVIKQSLEAKSPLVFIIDELDRCKPSFALNVLERMKHIFSADDVCFVLVTHLDELSAMVKHAYGLQKPYRYLDKFYHRRVDINTLLAHGKVDKTKRYLEYLVDNMSAPALFNDHYAQTVLAELCGIHNLSLRSIERTALYLGLYDNTVTHRIGKQSPITITSEHGHKPMLVLRNHESGGLVAEVCVLRICNARLYRKAAHGQITFEDACEFFRFDSWNDSNSADARKEVWERLLTPDNSISPTMPHQWSRILPDICEHIDLFWQQDDDEK